MTLTAFAMILAGVLLNAVAQLARKATAADMGELSISQTAFICGTAGLMSELCGGSVLLWPASSSGYWHCPVDVSIAFHPMLSIGYIVNAFGAWALLAKRWARDAFWASVLL